MEAAIKRPTMVRAMALARTASQESDSRHASKVTQARTKKWVNQWNLVCGSPLDALRGRAVPEGRTQPLPVLAELRCPRSLPGTPDSSPLPGGRHTLCVGSWRWRTTSSP